MITSDHRARGIGYVPEQTILVDNIQGGITKEFRSFSSKNRVELQSYFAKAEVTLYKNLIVNGSIRADGSTKLRRG